MHHVQSSGGALLLQGFQMFQVLLPLVLAMAAFYRWISRPQATDQDIQVYQKLLNDGIIQIHPFGSSKDHDNYY